MTNRHAWVVRLPNQAKSIQRYIRSSIVKHSLKGALEMSVYCLVSMISLLLYYAAIPIGRITSLALPSVHLSVRLFFFYARVPNSKIKSRDKPKLVRMFHRAGVTGVSNFSLKGYFRAIVAQLWTDGRKVCRQSSFNV